MSRSAGRRNHPSFLSPVTHVDSSTLLCRTPTGDSEVAVPASGLSITQRRILTLLDTPARLGELPLGPSIDAERLCREAHRLAQAGLIASAAVVADPADAANAATLRRLGPPRLPRGVLVGGWNPGGRRPPGSSTIGAPGGPQ